MRWPARWRRSAPGRAARRGGRSSRRRRTRARALRQQFHPEAHPARDQRHMPRGRAQRPELGVQQQPAALGDDQQFAVRVAEDPVGHGRVGGVQMHGHPAALPRVAVAAQRPEPRQEVGAPGVLLVLPARRARGRFGQRTPAQPVGIGLRLVEGRAPQAAVVRADEAGVRRRGADAVEPRAAVVRPGLGERAAAQLLRVQAQRRPLGGVASEGQCARLGLAAVLVAEPGLVGQLPGRAARLIPCPAGGGAGAAAGGAVGALPIANSRRIMNSYGGP